MAGMKRPRISLLSLMLLMAVLCVILGVPFGRARSQRLAVETILKKQGDADYENGFAHLNPDGPQVVQIYPFGPTRYPLWLMKSLGLDFFESLDTVQCGRQTIDDDLLFIGRAQSIKTLVLAKCKITSKGLAH